MSADDRLDATELRLNRQVDQWRDALLSLDRRQRQLYFKHTRTSTLELVLDLSKYADRIDRIELVGEFDEVEDGDTGETKRIRRNRPTGKAAAALVAGKTDSQLDRATRALDRQSETAFLDRGVWILYMALGMVRWVDPDSDADVETPLLMVPVRVERDNRTKRARLVTTEDDRQINPSLIAKLSRDFDIDLGDLDADESYALLADTVRKRLPSDSRWGLDDRTIVSLFTFHKEAMYRDLDANRQEVIDSPLAQLLALGRDAPDFQGFQFEGIPDQDLDRIQPPEDLHAILDADSTQRRCIAAAVTGRSFVMDGPPGTGKSQTIANIIAELLYRGKSVLFVSEKAAALDVVRKRLDSANLGPFVLELHSHKATRKSVAQELGDALTRKPVARSSFSPQDRHRVQLDRQRLTHYAQAANELRQPLGMSLHDVLGHLGRLRHLSDFAIRNTADFAELSAELLSKVDVLSRNLSRTWEPVSLGEGFLWREVQVASNAAATVNSVKQTAAAHAMNMRSLVDLSRAVCGDLNLGYCATVDQIDGIVALLQALEERPQLPVGLAEQGEVTVTLKNWLVDPLPHHVGEAVAKLTATHAAFDRARQTLAGFSIQQPLPVSLVDQLRKAPSVGSIDGVRWQIQAGAVLADARESLRQGQLIDDALDAGIAAAAELAEKFGLNPERLTVARCQDLLGLADLAQDVARPEQEWFNPALHKQLAESHRTLEVLVGDLRERQEKLSSVFTPEALDLALGEIAARVEKNRGLRRMTSQSRADRKALKQVTVAGRLDSETLALLREAVTWQQADTALRQAEEVHSANAGSHYRGTQTEFGRLNAALENARKAVELARDELDAGRLSANLAATGQPDSRIPRLASELQHFLEVWHNHAAGAFGEDNAVQASSVPLGRLAAWLRDALIRLDASVTAWAQAEQQVDQSLSVEKIEQLVAANDDYRATQNAVEAVVADEQHVLGCFADPNDAVVLAAAEHAEWVSLVRSRFPQPMDSGNASGAVQPLYESEELAKLVESSRKSARELLGLFPPPAVDELESELLGLLSGVELSQRMVDTADHQVPLWVEFAALRGQLAELHLGQLFEEIENRRVNRNDIPDVFRRALLAAWVDCLTQQDQRLAEYRAETRDDIVAAYRMLDTQLVGTQAAAIVNRCSERRPSLLAGSAAYLVKQAQLSRRHKPIRESLATASDIVQVLKPCFMMSPLAVSQYLPPNLIFDVVIFDEASQVLPEDAANCIYRGRQLIVAGDQNQLPPTNFFRATEDVETGNDDLDEMADFKSLLDLCKAQGMMSLPLRWHYRSRHEHLIAFSNYRFYGGKLHTFPGAEESSDELGIASFLVDGVYRRGAQRDNPVEAATVVDRVLEHLHNRPDDSVGVVAFSSAQEDAVIVEMERRAEQHPELLHLLHNEDRLDGFFVKNLENVQGDERDIIIFTVGYGRDEAGRFTAVIPTLNGEGGWKRLNVAITRAKKRVEIVHSVVPGDFPSTAKHGLEQLRRYVDYAMNGPITLAIDLQDAGGDAESPFEEDVISVIRAWGYDVVPQVGTAGYRIDMAIRHPHDPGRFLLGVECDGAAYHSSKVARDRDRLREQVLTGLGWKLHRIWGLSWYRNRAEQEKRLLQAIEAGLADPAEGKPTDSIQASVEIDEEIVDSSSMPEWATAFEPPSGVAVRNYWFGAEDLVNPAARHDLSVYITDVLEGQTPIHRDLVEACIRDDWGVGRIGHRARAVLDKIYEVINERSDRFTFDGEFFRDSEAPDLAIVRAGATFGGHQRSVAQVPNEEIALALVLTTRDAHSITRSELKQFVKGIFGWNRLGSEIDARLDQTINGLVRNGSLEEKAGQLSVMSGGG